jgi:hypothetical protein
MISYLYKSEYEVKAEPNLVSRRIRIRPDPTTVMRQSKGREFAFDLAGLPPSQYQTITDMVWAFKDVSIG